MTPSQSRTAIAGIRAALAAGTWLIPRNAGRLFGISADDNPAVPYMARLYGAREALMAVDLMSSGQPEAVAGRHLIVDALDVAASLLAARGGYLGVRASVVTGATAAALLALGVRASQAA